MQRLAVGLLCLSVLSGCTGKSPRGYPAAESRRLEADFDHAWEAGFRVLTDRGYEVLRQDRAAGTMETAWLTVNAGYSSGFFLTENEDRYSDCGKPGLGRTYWGKQARLVVLFSAVGNGQTEFVARAAFRTEQKTLFFRAAAVRECQSRGRLEEEILVQTQIRALTNQLQRYRRGWQ